MIKKVKIQMYLSVILLPQIAENKTAPPNNHKGSCVASSYFVADSFCCVPAGAVTVIKGVTLALYRFVSITYHDCSNYDYPLCFRPIGFMYGKAVTFFKSAP